MKFKVFILLTVLGTSGAQASFDMLLLASRTTGDSTVTRYDPVNNVNLGTIQIMGSANGLVVDQASGTFYTVSEGMVSKSLQRYSIWTGELVSEVVLPGSYVGTSGLGYTPKIAQGAPGEGIITLEYGIQRVNLSSGALIGSPIGWPGTDFRTGGVRGVYLANGEYGMVGETDGSPFTTDRVMLFNNANTWRSSYILPTNEQFTFIRDLVGRGNQMMLTVNSQENDDEVFLLTRGTNSFTGQRIARNTSSTRLMTEAEFGHGTSAYVMYWEPNTSNYYYRSVSTLTGAMSSERAFGGGVQVWDTAIFLAPEPGTMTALGLGALAVLRKRRKNV